MYCPACGSDERQPSQYCRVCGTDLRAIRATLERPDSITASAASARDRIGIAIAERIRQVEKAKDLEHIAEDVLPHIEKFLESPEERRLRRIRAGLITAALGLGATIGTFMLAMDKSDLLPLVVPMLIIFLVGIGVMVNGLWFTLPRKRLPEIEFDGYPPEFVTPSQPGSVQTNDLRPSNYQELPPTSIAEHTTHHLGPADTK